MRTIVIDTNCMVQMYKGGLLSGLLSLPYRFVIPQPLFENEFLSIPAKDKAELVQCGLDVRILAFDQIERSEFLQSRNRNLSFNDCSAFVIASDIEDSILLTGDKPLRRHATSHAVEVHGVLWIIDEIHAANILSPRTLHRALIVFVEDEFIWLPEEDLAIRLRKFRKLSQTL